MCVYIILNNVCVCKTEHPSNITASPAVSVSGRCRSPSQFSRGRVTSQVHHIDQHQRQQRATALAPADHLELPVSLNVSARRGAVGRSQGTWSEPRKTRSQSWEWNQQPSCRESTALIAAPPSCFTSNFLPTRLFVAGPFRRRNIPPAVARLLL